ncbi:hypothetical protein EZS27_022777 [termite gut metagenome]|uniref:Uncharacterized protein n=1 Tax=termite gut metagenome TaxID=433724 RepID=A0A5J4R3N3_9ZZZZ
MLYRGVESIPFPFYPLESVQYLRLPYGVSLCDLKEKITRILI